MKKSIKTVNCEFLYKCPQIWKELSETNQKDIRFCNVCETNVYFTENENKLDQLRNEGKCVAIYQEDIEIDFTQSAEAEFLLGIPARSQDSVKLDNAESTQELIRFSKDEKILINISFNDLRRNVPGYVLNDCKSGSDGAVYFIERNLSERLYWDLYKCRELQTNAGIFVEVEKVGAKLEVEKLYNELEQVDVYVLGHEAIALGLPYHIDPYGYY